MTLQTFTDSHLMTNSGETTFMGCNRRYGYEYVLGWRTEHQAKPFRFGSLWHLGIGYYEQAIPINESLEAVQEEYRKTPCPPYMEMDEYAVEAATCLAMIRGHYDRWHDEASLETIAVEVPFDLPIINPTTGAASRTYRNAGKIDRIAKLPDGRIALVERKTAGEEIGEGSDYWRRLLMDNQISRYYLAAKDLGYDVQTVVYDVQRKPMIKPKAISKADRALATSNGHYFGLPLAAECPERETPELYSARLLDDMRQRPEFYFARKEISRLESDLLQFQREHWITIHQIRECELTMEKWGLAAWPRNTRACTGFGKCPHLTHCRNHGDGEPTEVPHGFVQVNCVHPELDNPHDNEI